MHVNQVGKEPLEFMSSADGLSTEDLLTVKYTRVQQASPEYQQVYEGIDQNVDVKISTFLFRAAPEPVVTLYDFIMTTFVPQNKSGGAENRPAPGTPEDGNTTPEIVVDAGGSPEKIRVLLTLASIQGMHATVRYPGQEHMLTRLQSSSSMTMCGSRRCRSQRPMSPSSCVRIPCASMAV